MQSAEPSSPALTDLTAPFRQEIKDLKAKLSQVNANFTYYEESNERLENQVDDQVTLLERKDAEIARLKAHINATTTEHQETAEENVKLRRQSSTYEKIVEANAQELRSVAGLEATIEDREAEVRQFSIDLATIRTERDDKITEVKGLEGDVAELYAQLEAKDAEIEILLEKLGVVERHININPGLPVEELDDVMYQHMERWTAMRDDGSTPPPSRPARKAKRESIGGMNLADEFSALSDEDHDSQDGDYDSEASSAGSVASRRAAARKEKQNFRFSEIRGVEIQPSSIKPVPRNINRESQTSPVASPKTASTNIQTDTITSPKKKSLSQVITKGVQTSPIAALIQKFTFSDTSSSGVQTSPVAASPKTVAHQSFSEILSKGVSPVAASTETKVSDALSEIINIGVETSPVAAVPDALTEVISIGVETRPIAAVAEERKPFSEVVSDGVQTSPVTPSPTKPTSPRKPFAEVLSNGVSTSPITPTKETAASSTESPGVSSPSNIPLPPSPAVNSPISTKPSTSAKSPLSNEVTEDQIETSSPAAPTKPSKLNIKRPRVPTKEMSPTTLAHYKSIAAPRPNPMLAPSTPTVPTKDISPTTLSEYKSIAAPRPNPMVAPATPTTVPTKGMSPTTLSDYKAIAAPRPNPMVAPATPTTVPTKGMSPTTLSEYKAIAAPRPNPMLAPDTPTTTAPPDRRQKLSTLISATISPLWQDILSTGLYYWPLLLLCFSTVWTAAYLGSAAANSAAEWSWANANGYAPENKYVYVGKSVPGHLGRMVLGLVGWVWSLVFGGWWVGAGSRLPLSPG